MNIFPPPAERLAGSEPLATQEIATYAVGAAVWAPSAHNTQPWWFSASGQQISLLAGAGRQLMVADPGGRPPASCPPAACEHLGSSHG
jgi:hypothetical protein